MHVDYASSDDDEVVGTDNANDFDYDKVQLRRPSPDGWAWYRKAAEDEEDASPSSSSARKRAHRMIVDDDDHIQGEAANRTPVSEAPPTGRERVYLPRASKNARRSEPIDLTLDDDDEEEEEEEEEDEEEESESDSDDSDDDESVRFPARDWHDQASEAEEEEDEDEDASEYSEDYDDEADDKEYKRDDGFIVDDDASISGSEGSSSGDSDPYREDDEPLLDMERLPGETNAQYNARMVNKAREWGTSTLSGNFNFDMYKKHAWNKDFGKMLQSPFYLLGCQGNLSRVLDHLGDQDMRDLLMRAFECKTEDDEFIDVDMKCRVVPVIPNSVCDCCNRKRRLEYKWKLVPEGTRKRVLKVGIDCHSKMFVLAELYNHLRSIALPRGPPGTPHAGYTMFGLDPELDYGSTDDAEIRRGFNVFKELMMNRGSAICNVRMKYRKGWKVHKK